MNPILDAYHQDVRIDLDLGDNHLLHYVPWNPDRALNPQDADLPDIERCGAAIYHLNSEGKPCQAFIHFDTPEIRRVFGDHVWQVVSWEPLTLTPSVLCRSRYGGSQIDCNDHGFIEAGKWRRA